MLRDVISARAAQSAEGDQESTALEINDVAGVVKPDCVVREVYIDATADEVFPYFIDRAQCPTWLGTAAKLDVQPGGVYQVNLNEVDMIVIGQYLEVNPPRRLKFTWSWIGPGYTIP